MKAALLTFAVLLVGCEKSDYQLAIEQYQCTDTQMQKASSETLFCKKETEYSAELCYGAAIMRNCELKGTDK
jgi:hypothetical protein